MKTRSVCGFVVFMIVLVMSLSATAGEQPNLVSAKAGAKIVAFSSNYESDWDVANLIGANENWYGELPVWCTASEAPFPHWVVVELPKPTWFTTMIFNNFIPEEEGWPGISAKAVQVQVSARSAEEGFKTVASFQLERNKNGQEVRLEPVEGRWLKITVTDNWGNPEFTELGQLGVFDDGSRPQDLARELKGKGYVDVYGLYFDFGSAHVREESRSALETIVSFLEANPSSKLVIEGHTDNIGEDKANQTLSESRAGAVVAAVAKLGVDPGRLSAVGYGAARPVGDNKMITGRAQNRRVTVRVAK